MRKAVPCQPAGESIRPSYLVRPTPCPRQSEKDEQRTTNRASRRSVVFPPSPFSWCSCPYPWSRKNGFKWLNWQKLAKVVLKLPRTLPRVINPQPGTAKQACTSGRATNTQHSYGGRISSEGLQENTSAMTLWSSFVIMRHFDVGACRCLLPQKVFRVCGKISKRFDNLANCESPLGLQMRLLPLGPM